MIPNIELAKSRDFGEMINDTFTFVKQNWKPLIKNYFIFCGFFTVAGTALMIIQQYKAVNLINSASGMPATFETVSSIKLMGVGYFVSIAFFLISYCACMLMVLCYMSIYKEKGNIAPGSDEIWAYFKYYFLKTIGATFIVSLLLSAGFVFCLIPGFYLYPILGLIFPIMIIENTTFGYAFNRSFQLIKGNWWLTAGVIFVTWIIVYFISIFFQIPAALIGISSVLLQPQKGVHLSLTSIIFSISLQQVCQLFLIIPTIAIGLCYFNLSEAKEGTSLLDRINKFGDNASQTDLPAEEY